MKTKSFALGILVSLASLSLTANSLACTVVTTKDTKGNAYVGRTHEFATMLPDELTYYPVGSPIESQTPDGKPGKTFNTKYAIVGATLKGMVANQKQDTIHEAMNDQGLAVSALAFGMNSDLQPDAPADKILSVVDFGAWALGNFKSVREVKQALVDEEVAIWLPRIKPMGDVVTPVHYSVIDRTGDAIVIEFNGNKVNVHDNPVRAMTNDPAFPWHLENLNNYAQLTNVDKNTGEFGALRVNSSGGNAKAGLPASDTSQDRFVRAAFYSTYTAKEKTPETAIKTLAHAMNNFDRVEDITIDLPGSAPAIESTGRNSSSEITYFTALHDLTRNHLYLRTINAMNFTKFDMKKLAALPAVKVIPFAAIDADSTVDGTDLYVN